jgi:hypothetical protein
VGKPFWYAPPRPVFLSGDKESLKERRKAHEEWRKELRERDKEARERSHEWYRGASR